MTLRLLEPPPAPPRLDLTELVETLVLARAAVDYEHVHQMMGTALRVAQGHASARSRLALRVVELGHREPTPIEHLDRVAEALRVGLGQDWGENEAGRMVLKMALEAVTDDRHRRKVRQELWEAEWGLYQARWGESDLPGEPDLRHTAKRNLVKAGVWRIEQLSDIAELGRTVKGVGPKTVSQLKAIRHKWEANSSA